MLHVDLTGCTKVAKPYISQLAGGNAFVCQLVVDLWIVRKATDSAISSHSTKGLSAVFML